MSESTTGAYVYQQIVKTTAEWAADKTVIVENVWLFERRTDGRIITKLSDGRHCYVDLDEYGLGAWDAAKLGGYKGTKEEFYKSLGTFEDKVKFVSDAAAKIEKKRETWVFNELNSLSTLSTSEEVKAAIGLDDVMGLYDLFGKYEFINKNRHTTDEFRTYNEYSTCEVFVDKQEGECSISYMSNGLKNVIRFDDTQGTNHISSIKRYNTLPIDSLSSTDRNSPLSAAQGKIINDRVSKIVPMSVIYIGEITPETNIPTEYAFKGGNSALYWIEKRGGNITGKMSTLLHGSYSNGLAVYDGKVTYDGEEYTVTTGMMNEYNKGFKVLDRSKADVTAQFELHCILFGVFEER